MFDSVETPYNSPLFDSSTQGNSLQFCFLKLRLNQTDFVRRIVQMFNSVETL